MSETATPRVPRMAYPPPAAAGFLGGLDVTVLNTALPAFLVTAARVGERLPVPDFGDARVEVGGSL